jgi:hypothetical protein
MANSQKVLERTSQMSAQFSNGMEVPSLRAGSEEQSRTVGILSIEKAFRSQFNGRGPARS